MTNLTLEDSRYDRQERIWWWDQSKLRESRVLVIGAGALGNEIVKNLALVGVGHIDIVDMDRIEHSNLARCALFRDADEGRFKSEVLAEAAALINPEVTIRAFVHPVQQFGIARLRDYDLAIGGLDNREARLWVNQAARLIGMYWVDGAIEGLQGVVRVFGPDGPCYECTLGEVDRQLLSHRRSCALLSPEAIEGGRTPANATSASVVAALEVQEAIKILVGRIELVALEGSAWRMEGETMLTSVMSYFEDPNCMAHDRATRWIDLPTGVRSLAAACSYVEAELNSPIEVLYLPDDLIVIEQCSSCGAGERIVGLRGVLPNGAGQCDGCGGERSATAQSALSSSEPLVSEDMSNWFWPSSEAVSVRVKDEYVHLAIGVRDDTD